MMEPGPVGVQVKVAESSRLGLLACSVMVYATSV